MSFKLENGGDVGGVRDVELVVENDSDRQTFTEDSVQIGNGCIYSSYPKWLTFPWVSAPGTTTTRSPWKTTQGSKIRGR